MSTLLPHEIFTVSLGSPSDPTRQTGTPRSERVAVILQAGRGEVRFGVSAPTASEEARLMAIDLNGFEMGSQELPSGTRATPVGRRHRIGEFFLGRVELDQTQFTVLRSEGHVQVINGRPDVATVARGARVANGILGLLADTTANYTYDSQKDLATKGMFGKPDVIGPHGYFQGHPLLGRNSRRIAGSVMLTTRPGSEAVLVDNESHALQTFYSDFRHEYLKPYKGKAEHIVKILHELNQYILMRMPYDLPAVTKIERQYPYNSYLIPLSYFVEQGFGVCRQHALAAGFIIEQLLEEYRLPAHVTLGRNVIGYIGGHAWVEMKVANSQAELVVDPTQQFVGTKKEAEALRRWQYNLRSPGH